MPVVLPVYDLKGERVEEIELEDEIFSFPLKEDLIHQVVVGYEANRRLGTASTKTRAEVSGGGRKPWRQKGTGRARAGSTRSPIWRHGGVTFGPKPRDFSQRLPKKMRKVALKSALSAKIRDNEVKIIQEFGLEEPKTKKMAEVFHNLSLPAKVLVITDQWEENVAKSIHNLPGASYITFQNLNTYDALYYDCLLFTKRAIVEVGEVLKLVS